ncbi:hypothetical protein A6A03_01015 [Chloroflexus islandicus]|uniref:Galactose oxidase n=1 Tax=Chloroflexus islandicus TaxID=1707952 RepID=A0A178MF14_9CHLR|nr:hypothetical protein [Chloroflexus islandicus]OAN47352.1 hypothetical protein A6A03_01015 [Chloroflexus islandicus]
MDNRFRIMLVVAGMIVIAAAGIVIALRVSHLPAQPPLPLNTSSSPVTPAAPDSANWRHLGSDAGVPFNDLVAAIAFDADDADGNLYVGGAFTDVAGVPEADYLAVWSPVTQQWSALGGANGFGALNALVSTIVVTGDLVYVGGSFTDAAGIAEADGVAVWNTTTRRWAALGDNGKGDGAIQGTVASIAIAGQRVYVGGNFLDASGIPAADYVAVWDGRRWAALGDNGQGDGALANAVSRLAVAGDILYAGGLFQDAASIAAADFIAAWDGRRWSALGSNGQGDGALNHLVAAIVVAGDKVYVGGLFTDIAGIAHADYLAVWDGAQWAALSDRSDFTPLTGEVYALAFDHRGNLYVGGAFTDLAGIAAADYVAVWDGAAWAALGSNGHGDGALRNIVVTLAVDQSNQIYVGGNVSNVAAIDAADYVALWDGARWQALPHVAGGVLTAPVRTITFADDKVYVASGGINFAEAGAAPFAAMWDSTRQAWSDLDPQGAFQHGLQINVLRHDGTRLYAGGWFTDAAGPAADYIAVWDGAQWSALGDNGRGDGALTNMVTVLFIAEDGNLYVAGFFQDAAGIPEADNVAVWNGADWQALGSGDSAVRGAVWAMTVIDGALYIGGSFTSASDPTISFIAMWDGTRWAPLDDGRGSTLNGEVTAMVVSSDKLYVGGAFTDVAGIAEADYVAVWNVTTRQWSALGSNGRGDGAMADRVNALAVDSKGNLYVGGFFTDVAGMPAADNIAVWNGAQWSALGDNGRGESALNGEVFALAVMGNDLYIGGNFTNAGQNPRADYIVVYSLTE